MGQHPGIIKLKQFKNPKKGVGQHHRNGGSTWNGTVGQHVPESTLKFRDTSGKAHGAFKEGSGFFIKDKGKLYFITANHVLAMPDFPLKGTITSDSDSIMIVCEDDGISKSSPCLFELNVKNFREKTKSVKFIYSPDVTAYEVLNKDNYPVNIIESYSAYYLPKKMGEISVWGFPADKNKLEKGNFIVNPKSQITTKKYSLKYDYKFPEKGKMKIDSFNYVINPTDYKVVENLRGYSGSPAFVKDLSTNKWVFLGVMAGIQPELNLMFFVKPTYISFNKKY